MRDAASLDAGIRVSMLDSMALVFRRYSREGVPLSFPFNPRDMADLLDHCADNIEAQEGPTGALRLSPRVRVKHEDAIQ